MILLEEYHKWFYELRTRTYFVANEYRMDFYAVLLINYSVTNVKVVIAVDGSMATKENRKLRRRIIITIGENTTAVLTRGGLIITITSTWIIPTNFYIYVVFYYGTAVSHRTIVCT